MKIPRIVLGGTTSKAGKTVISIGLMRALKNRGYEVAPFKTGPDFIDPSYHKFATGIDSRNLDSFMMKPEVILESFIKNAKNADIAVIEGAMGFYDSHDALDEKGSTAHISKILSSPVILVANVKRISRTAAALLLGYKLFDKAADIKGVILNKAGSERHAEKVKKAVEKLAGIEVLGVIPRDGNAKIPERHLGLVPAYEREKRKLFNYLGEFVEAHTNVDRIIEIANDAKPLTEVVRHSTRKLELATARANCLAHNQRKKYKATLGIIRDKVFTFYYQDNIDAFLACGAKIKYIDSLKDERLPKIDALYIGGGFPEVFASELEENVSLHEDIYSFCDRGKPVYAECGGLMYLGESIETEGREYRMVGFLPIKTKMQAKFQALGYTVAKAMRNTPICKKDDIVIGHEFHNSKIKITGEIPYVYKMIRGRGIDGKYDGILIKNTMASYTHVHMLSYPSMIENFLGFSSIKNRR